MHIAIDVREEIDGDAGANAFLVALEEDFFQGLKYMAVYRENNFVDDFVAEEVGELIDGMDGVGSGETDIRGIRAGAGRDKALEADTLIGSYLKVAGKAQRTFTEADYEDKTKGAKLAANDSDEPAGGEPEDEEQSEEVEGKEREKGTAEVEAEEEFGDDKGHGAVSALAQDVTDDNAALTGTEVLVDVEPVAGKHPTQDAEAEDERCFFSGEVKKVTEREGETGLVCSLESDGNENDVRQPEEQPGFAVLVAKHFARRWPSYIVGRGVAKRGGEMLHYLGRQWPIPQEGRVAQLAEQVTLNH
jgi:hypothetical protein